MVYLESVKSFNDINNLKDNNIVGNPEIINSVITFKGNNNLLICEKDVKLIGANIHFEANNSIIYLSSTNSCHYSFNALIYNNCTLFIGKNNNIGSAVNFNIMENQNIIIGDDGIIGSGVSIRTADSFPMYDGKTKKRINFANSVFIGDHVLLNHLSYVSKGVKIGSGSIIDNDSFIPQDEVISSNLFCTGNPVKVTRENVFFTMEYVGFNKIEDSLASKDYKSNIFIFEFKNNETLDLNKIDKILKELDVEQRQEFIVKLFVNNKRKNRFFIK